ncbi:MAG: hypothetical protein Q7S86_01530 [bacterium]|nr:hypothetical protein [bacterium]
MPKKVILFRDVAIIQLSSFLDAYEKSFVQLFNDSGIWSEEIIVEQYKNSAKNIYDSIFEGILLKLSGDKVLGRKKQKKDLFEIKFYVGSRLIIVYYSENNERIVETINIGRKLIPF